MAEGSKSVRREIYFVFSLVVVVAVFGYLLTHVDVKDVISLIRNIDIGGVWIFLVLILSMSIFRTWRYDLVLKTAGYAASRPALFLIVLVRNFCSDLLPARIGSVVYIYLVNSRLGIPFAPAASSFALAFLFDIIALAPMIGIAALWVGAEAGLSVAGLVIGGGVLLVISVAVLRALPALVKWGAGIVGSVKFLGDGNREKWSKALVETGDQVAEAKQAGIYGRLLVVSFFIRFLKYASLYMLLFAMLKPLGFGFAKLSVPKVFIGVCSGELAASLPVGTIIGMGAYEGTWAFVFTLLGFPSDLAMQTSISHHLFTQLYGYSLGIMALLVLLLPFFRREVPMDESCRKLGSIVTFGLGVLVLGGCTAALAVAGSSAVWGMKKPRPAADLKGPVASEREALTSFGLAGRIYFDSNRGGTFGIWSMKGDGSDIRKVLDTDRAEMFPDLSPDRKLVVFASATSPNRMAPADIWVCGVDGKGARKVIENGTFPTFSADGKTIYFERKQKKVMAVLSDGTGEREVFPKDNADFMKYKIIMPRVSPDGKWVAFISDKGTDWNSWVINASTGEALHIGVGCEPAWFPDSSHIVFVQKKGVKGGTGLFKFDLQTAKTEKLYDGDEPWGHEYFPGVSDDGRYLFWSACPPGQHSHETSNYQLFAQDLKNGRVVRLLFDGHNNRWPKWALE